MLFTPARPFRTFQSRAWVSSYCAQSPAAPGAGSCLHLCQVSQSEESSKSFTSRREEEDQAVRTEFFWTGLWRWGWWRCCDDVFMEQGQISVACSRDWSWVCSLTNNIIQEQSGVTELMFLFSSGHTAVKTLNLWLCDPSSILSDCDELTVISHQWVWIYQLLSRDVL